MLIDDDDIPGTRQYRLVRIQGFDEPCFSIRPLPDNCRDHNFRRFYIGRHEVAKVVVALRLGWDELELKSIVQKWKCSMVAAASLWLHQQAIDPDHLWAMIDAVCSEPTETVNADR